MPQIYPSWTSCSKYPSWTSCSKYPSWNSCSKYPSWNSCSNCLRIFKLQGQFNTLSQISQGSSTPWCRGHEVLVYPGRGRSLTSEDGVGRDGGIYIYICRKNSKIPLSCGKWDFLDLTLIDMNWSSFSFIPCYHTVNRNSSQFLQTVSLAGNLLIVITLWILTRKSLLQTNVNGKKKCWFQFQEPTILLILIPIPGIRGKVKEQKNY